MWSARVITEPAILTKCTLHSTKENWLRFAGAVLDIVQCVCQNSPQVLFASFCSLLQKRHEITRERATKFVKSLKKKSYEERFRCLNLYLLERRRVWGDSIEIFKILNSFEGINPEQFLSRASWPYVPVRPGQSRFRALCPGVPKGNVRDAIIMSMFAESRPSLNRGHHLWLSSCQCKPSEERRSSRSIEQGFDSFELVTLLQITKYTGFCI